MPERAFIPGPLAQAQPRVYKSLRGRQLKGLVIAGAGSGLALLLFGARDAAGFTGAFLAALPGFAYGYYEPEGKPVEYWGRVLLRYYLKPRRLITMPVLPIWKRTCSRVRTLIRAAARTRRLDLGKEEIRSHGF